jgi:hypothetical protein
LEEKPHGGTMDIIDELIDNIQKDDVTKKEWLMYLLKKNIERIKAAGVVMVEVQYNGYGDSGDIDDTTLYSEHPENTNWTKFIAPAIVKHIGIHLDDMHIEKFFEELAWEYIPGGFEVDEGSSGTVTFDLKKKKIYLEHGYRIQNFDIEEYEI